MEEICEKVNVVRKTMRTVDEVKRRFLYTCLVFAGGKSCTWVQSIAPVMLGYPATAKKKAFFGFIQ